MRNNIISLEKSVTSTKLGVMLQLTIWGEINVDLGTCIQFVLALDFAKIIFGWDITQQLLYKTNFYTIQV